MIDLNCLGNLALEAESSDFVGEYSYCDPN
jgi:hypothetical protein